MLKICTRGSNMLTILYEDDDPLLMEKVWSFRHRRFVEQMEWNELRRRDQRERDQYDRPDIVHAVLVHKKEVIGYSRLLPTTAPHFARDYSQLAPGSLPSGPDIFEWSRCATALNAPFINGIAASDLLMTGVLECLVRMGAKAILFLTYPPLVMMMRQRGYPVQVLADVTLQGHRVEVAYSIIPDDLLSRHYKDYGIAGEVLCLRTRNRSGLVHSG